MKINKNLVHYLLEQYAKMPGEKKIRIGMDISEAARELRHSGAIQTKTTYGVKSSRTA